MEKREVVIVEVLRTAFGKMGGSLKDFTGEELGAIALKGLVEKTGITDKAHVDSVFAGSAFPMACAMNPARWAVLKAGLPFSTSASFVEMQCGSAIDSINHAAWKILCNQADIVIAGGMESFSQLPVALTSQEPYRLKPPKLLDFQLEPPSNEKDTYGPFRMGLSREPSGQVWHLPGGAGRVCLPEPVAGQEEHRCGVFYRRDHPCQSFQGKKSGPSSSSWTSTLF